MAVYKTKKKLNKAEEAMLAKKQFACYSRARDNGHEDYVEIAKQCDAYYRGVQWDPEDIQLLDDQGRPALTINTLSHVGQVTKNLLMY